MTRLNTQDCVRAYPDGREVCDLKSEAGRVEYKRRLAAMWVRQRGTCGLQLTSRCRAANGKLYLERATFEHQDGRGMGGARRDDRIVKDGKPYNMAACWECNHEKGSRRLSNEEAE